MFESSLKLEFKNNREIAVEGPEAQMRGSLTSCVLSGAQLDQGPRLLALGPTRLTGCARGRGAETQAVSRSGP